MHGGGNFFKSYRIYVDKLVDPDSDSPNEPLLLDTINASDSPGVTVFDISAAGEGDPPEETSRFAYRFLRTTLKDKVVQEDSIAVDATRETSIFDGILTLKTVMARSRMQRQYGLMQHFYQRTRIL